MKDNELIAEFIGFVPKKGKRHLLFAPPPYETGMTAGFQMACYAEDLKFHSSWDWLMPVVEQIEEIEEPHPSNNPEKGTIWPYQFEILSRNTVQIIDNRTDDCIVTINDDKKTKIQSVYTAVVDFIKWYNNQPKP